MILTVTLNPAYDVTYRVDRVELGSVHRVSEVLELLGGKGVNVSRVLMQLGVPTVAMGFADAAFSEWRVLGISDRLPGILGGADHRYEGAFRAGIECPLEVLRRAER